MAEKKADEEPQEEDASELRFGKGTCLICNTVCEMFRVICTKLEILASLCVEVSLIDKMLSDNIMMLLYSLVCTYPTTHSVRF